MNEGEAPAADILGGVGIVEAERIQRQPREDLLPGLWLDDTAQEEAACERNGSWLGWLFTHRITRDALRFMDGRHGWGWRYLNKYTLAGEPTLILNHYEKVLDLVA